MTQYTHQIPHDGSEPSDPWPDDHHAADQATHNTTHNTNHQAAQDITQDAARNAASYAEQLATQLRKGFLAYCVLKVCSGEAQYTSDIIGRLRSARLVVVEGTVYPLLSRLQKDGLLSHEWQESEQGPPRKYYRTTPYGDEVRRQVGRHIAALNASLKKL